MNVVKTLSILVVLSFATLAFGQEKLSNTNAVATQTQQIDQGSRFISNVENGGLIDHSLMNNLRTSPIANAAGGNSATTCIPFKPCGPDLVCCPCGPDNACISTEKCNFICRQ